MSVQLSPDGRQAALTIQQDSFDLWTYSFERGTLSRLTTDAGTEFDPGWSPDGRELFYVVDRPPFELHRIEAGAPGMGKPLWNEPANMDTFSVAVSPNGRRISFGRTEEKTGQNLYVRPLDGSEPPKPVRASQYEERYATFSPDGRWITYQSDETGRPEIYVEAVDGTAERHQISADGGTSPTWARNGDIIFRHRDEFRVVTTRRGRNLEFDAPRTLFSFVLAPALDVDSRTYDVSADGMRILAVRIPEGSIPRQIEIVTDWASQLPQLAPPAR